MNLKQLKNLPIGEVKYFESIGSTNDEALVWAAKGAPHLSIVIADEQVAGRGRLNRKWFTPKGSALAFSLILRPTSVKYLSRTVGLAALSIADSCLKQGLTPQIKWPNDVLLKGKKLAGILIETVWAGDKVDSLIIGMGINVFKESIPPVESLQFPATSFEHELGQLPQREVILQDILSSLLTRLPQIDSDEFLRSWENLLAYRGEQVRVTTGKDEFKQGKLLGLTEDGSLRLLENNGNELSIHFGDVSLRPAA
jgi:BirA family biotin operon repressor/biotin-[acetyl-CoA-carboxylase] ligase